MTYTLGVDPSSIPSKTEYAAVDESGAWVNIADIQWSGHYPTAVVIEWAPFDCNYQRGGKFIPNTGAMMALAGEQQRILDMYRDVCPVYCVPRRVILAQAGYSPRRDGPADKWVSGYLHAFGYARATSKKGLPNYTGYTWRASPLNTTDKRDALMAALFRYNDPRNKEYQVNE